MAYSGTSLAAKHPTIANLYPMIVDQYNSNLILFAYCTGTPDTTASTYEHGAIMIQIDTSTGARAIFENVGSSAAPSWQPLSFGPSGATSVGVARTNGTTPVQVFGTANGFTGTIKAVEVISQDDGNGTVSVRTTAGVAASIVKGSTNSVRGSGVSVNNSITAAGSVTVVSDSANDATVLVFYTAS